MKFLKTALLALGLGAMSFATQSIQAASVFLSGSSPVYTTVFNGSGPSSSFTATVDSTWYTSGDAGYSTYATQLGLTDNTDVIYAYIIHDLAQTPINDYLAHFSVKSGTPIDAVAYDTTPGGVAPASAWNLGDSAQFNFQSSVLTAGSSSTVLLFATSGVPVWQNGTLADGSSKSELVVSAAGPQGAGTPLPVPAAAGAGMGLFGVMAAGRRKK